MIMGGRSQKIKPVSSLRNHAVTYQHEASGNLTIFSL